MTRRQKLGLIALMGVLEPSRGHHGCCVGSDHQFHGLCKYLGLPIVGHPPISKTLISTCVEEFYGDDLLPAKPYIERNHDIVDVCDVLIAAPQEEQEILRSGTWATIRYARKTGKECRVLAP